MNPPSPKSRGAARNSNRGNLGNPRGRPKRNVDISVALNNALNDKIVVTNLGKTRTGLEAIVQSVVDRVLQGDSKGIGPLLDLFRKAKLVKPVPDPTRLTGVVVEPADYRKDKELGIEQGYYVFGGHRLWVHPVTKEFSYERPANFDENDREQSRIQTSAS